MRRRFRALRRLWIQGKTIAFLTLGDVTIYSTYGYVHQKLLSLGYESILVNGVPSFCTAAAKLGISLGEKAEAIHILRDPIRSQTDWSSREQRS